MGKGWGSFRGWVSGGVPGSRHLPRLAWEGCSRVPAGLAERSTHPLAPPTFERAGLTPRPSHSPSSCIWHPWGCGGIARLLRDQFGAAAAIQPADPSWLGAEREQASPPHRGPSPPFLPAWTDFGW